jgi:hypothetical protein
MYEPYSWLGMTSRLQQFHFYWKKDWCAVLDIVIQKYSEGDISGHLPFMFSCSSYNFRHEEIRPSPFRAKMWGLTRMKNVHGTEIDTSESPRLVSVESAVRPSQNSFAVGVGFVNAVDWLPLATHLNTYSSLSLFWVLLCKLLTACFCKPVSSCRCSRIVVAAVLLQGAVNSYDWVSSIGVIICSDWTKSNDSEKILFQCHFSPPKSHTV